MDKFDVFEYTSRTKYVSKKYPHISITLSMLDNSALIRVKREILADGIMVLQCNYRSPLPDELDRLMGHALGEDRRL